MKWTNGPPATHMSASSTCFSPSSTKIFFFTVRGGKLDFPDFESRHGEGIYGEFTTGFPTRARESPSAR